MPTVVLEQKRRKFLLIGGVVVAVVLILSAAGGFWLYQRYLDQRDTQRFDQLYGQIKTWQRHRDYDGGIRAYEAYVKEARTTDHRAVAYLMIGGMYEQKKDYAKAITAYQQVEAAGISNKDWILGYQSGIARSAQAKGDKALAITYYEKAAALAEKQDLVYSAETAEMYREQIRVLKGGK